MTEHNAATGAGDLEKRLRDFVSFEARHGAEAVIDPDTVAEAADALRAKYAEIERQARDGCLFPCEQLVKARAEIERLRALAADAIEEVEFWATYANDYFRDKHGYAPTIGALKSRLAALKEQDHD